YLSTFRRHFFNSSKEFKTLLGQLKEAKAEVEKTKKAAAKIVAEAENRAKNAELSKKKLEESVVRGQKIAKYTSNLKGEAKEKMRALLESAQTENLDKVYKKYLPEVLESKTATTVQTPKKRLAEATIEFKTGGHAPKTLTEADE